MNKTTLVFLLLCVVSLSVAKVLFVSPFGSNENSGISASSPLKSIKRAQLQAVHGDVIQLARGLYQGPNNCIVFDSVNVTLRGPAKLQCPEGLRIDGVNFNASDIFLPNITVSHADNVTLTHCKINRGFSSFAVSKLNLTQISFMRVSNISSFATNFTCTNCSVNGEALLNVTKGSFECVNCNFPLTFVNASKLTSFVTLNSTFSGIENSNMTTRKGLHKVTPYCNITSTNVTCEDSGFSGLTLYKANCSINNSTIENCSTGSNNTTNGTAININYSNCTCYNVTVQNNYGNSSIYVGSDSNFTMVNGSVSNNYGNDTTRGGGIYISSGSEAHVINSTLENNIAYVGGAFYVENGGKIFLTQTSIVRNTAFIAGDFACAVGRNIEDFIPVHLKECSVVENLAMSGVENNCSV